MNITKSIAAPVMATMLILGTLSSTAHAGSRHSTTEKAAIRCVAAGTVAGIITFLTTFSPSASAAVASGACVIAAGEEAIASELEENK